MAQMDVTASKAAERASGSSQVAPSLNGDGAATPDGAEIGLSQLLVDRTRIVIRPNNSRVVIRPFQPADDRRVERIIARVCALSEERTRIELDAVMRDFRDRHQKIRDFFLLRYQDVRRLMLTDHPVSEARQLLIGAYFTQEYALESAALFNPSMVWAPDQSGVPEGWKRFILSLRATGEGHISSITFRGGLVDPSCGIHLDEPTRYVTAPEAVPDVLYDKFLFLRKLAELRINGAFAEQVLDTLPEKFGYEELEAAIEQALQRARPRHHEYEPLATGMRTLARANYDVVFAPELNVSERIIFPYSPTETNGIEDARFVEFHEDDGSTTYYATYTAFDGKVVLPQILETKDFFTFKISTLNGPEVRNKGLALFPRKVNGLYCMLSRQDNENIFLMYSDLLHFWYTKVPIAKPTYAWEFVQLGNCGSPIETDAGWLVLTHGVGPMRRYAMGAFLLDKDDPSRLIGRLRVPLLEPNANEREGYVPNVVYSCGGAVCNGMLIIPYAMSDYASTFATIPVDDVLKAMV
jgi:predicted GH43/DUF377 family glycosyl hydrolase